MAKTRPTRSSPGSTPTAIRYRDWLVRALNHDMPYDRFILEQIAGDLIDGPDRAERLAALGFFACGPVYYGDAKKHDQYADRIDTLTRGFLGLTVACARCHDHKYDPIPTTDYYALEGVFASTEYVEVPAVPKEQVDAYDKRSGRDPGQGQGNHGVSEGGSRATETEESQATSSSRSSAMLPAEAKTKLKALRAELDRLKKKAPPKYPVIHTLAEAAKPTDMPVLIRGNPDTPGAKVPRHFLTVLGGDQIAVPARAAAGSSWPARSRVPTTR